MLRKHSIKSGIPALLAGELIRHVEQDGGSLYSLLDLVAALSDGEHPERVWAEMVALEPALGDLPEMVDDTTGKSEFVPMQAVDLQGAIRIVESSSSYAAQRYKQWIAQAVQQRVEEQDNPELAILRTRQAYESQGYDRRWIEKRLRGIASRHELTEEWFKRGAIQGQNFRDLTNLLFQSSFGMDVQTHRNKKGLANRRGDNLRDHMTDTELILTTLAESTAALLARDRDSHGVSELSADAQDAGAVVANVRSQLESLHQQRDSQPDSAVADSLVSH